MTYKIEISTLADSAKYFHLHEWMTDNGWKIKADYEWTTVIGVYDPVKVIIVFTDPLKALLTKLTWL